MFFLFEERDGFWRGESKRVMVEILDCFLGFAVSRKNGNYGVFSRFWHGSRKDTPHN